jgi:hypothetical protein
MVFTGYECRLPQLLLLIAFGAVSQKFSGKPRLDIRIIAFGYDKA